MRNLGRYNSLFTSFSCQVHQFLVSFYKKTITYKEKAMKKNILLFLLLTASFNQSQAIQDQVRASIQNIDRSSLALVIACLGVGLFVIDKSIPFLKHGWNYFNGIKPEEATKSDYVTKKEIKEQQDKYEQDKTGLKNEIKGVSTILTALKSEIATKIGKM
jgi:hypothetical protein